MKEYIFNGVEKDKRYEDVYGKWMLWMQDGAENGGVIIKNPPKSWLPLLKYFDISYNSPISYFPCDEWIGDWETDYEYAENTNHLREYIESCAVNRPELVDGLWKYNMQWNPRVKREHKSKNFTITNTNSFFRPELVEYMKKINEYVSDKKKCVIVPCAADKPYPSVLHSKVKELLPDDSWHIIVGSGTPGLVPEELWSEMPYYDAGIPNEWRIENMTTNFFSRNHYDIIIVYEDFYNLPLMKALSHVQNDMFRNTKIIFVNPIGFYHDYTNLMSEKSLGRLKDAINGDY